MRGVHNAPRPGLPPLLTAEDTLDEFIHLSARPEGAWVFHDCGWPLLLAASLRSGRIEEGLAYRSFNAWLVNRLADATGLGRSGGLADLVIGLYAFSSFDRRHGLTARRLESRLLSDHCRAGDLSWSDYDIVRGPAGVLLGLLTVAPQSELIPLLARQLCQIFSADLAGPLRAAAGPYETVASVNLGVAHGLPGVVLALAAAFESGVDCRHPLAVLATGLVACAYGAAGVDGLVPSHLAPGNASLAVQAWCYGSPGVSLAIAVAARALNDDSLLLRARGLYSTWHSKYPVGQQHGYGFCHGLAGVVAITEWMTANRVHHCESTCTHTRNYFNANWASIYTSIVDARRGSLVSGVSGVIAVALAENREYERIVGVLGVPIAIRQG